MPLTKLDFTQVIRSSYDDATEAIKTIPAGATSFNVELDADDGDSVETRPMHIDIASLFDGLAADTDVDTDEVEILNYKGFCVVVNWTGLTGTLDGDMQLQASVENSVWFDVTGESFVLDSAIGAKYFNVGNAFYKYFRLSYTANSISGGSMTAQYVIKG